MQLFVSHVKLHVNSTCYKPIKSAAGMCFAQKVTLVSSHKHVFSNVGSE